MLIIVTSCIFLQFKHAAVGLLCYIKSVHQNDALRWVLGLGWALLSWGFFAGFVGVLLKKRPLSGIETREG